MKRILLLVTLSYSCSSTAAIDINKVKALFESGNSQAAYELTVNEAKLYEGDPNFDYYYGVSAIDTGHASEGVFALERVLALQPDNHSARLELARGYFILEEYSRARTEFKTVLEAEPPNDVVDKIYAFLDAIRLQEGRYNTIHNVYIELGFGTDSNTNGAPSNPDILLPDGTAQLNAASLEQKDSFYDFTANYGISTPITAGTSLTAAITANLHSNSDLSEFDTATYTGTTGLRFLHAQDAYIVDLIAQQFNVDDDEYRQLLGINTNWRRHLSQQSTLQIFLQYAQQDFDGQEEDRNVDTTTLGTGFSKRFNVALSPVLFTSLYLAQDNPETDSEFAQQSAERDYYGIRIGSIISVTSKSSVQLALSSQNSEYGLEIGNGILRQDDYVSADLDYTWLLDRNWSLRANANVTQNDSNITLNEYDRTQLSINLRYEMK